MEDPFPYSDAKSIGDFSDRVAYRRWMVENGTPYPGLRSLRRALDTGEIDTYQYKDVYWALVNRYKRHENRIDSLNIPRPERRCKRKKIKARLEDG